MTFQWLGTLVVNKEMGKSDTKEKEQQPAKQNLGSDPPLTSATILAVSGHALKAYNLIGSAHEVGWALERIGPNLPAPHLLPGTS